MWLFSRNPTNNFNYDIGENICEFGENSMFEGKRKSTGAKVSIFRYESKTPDDEMFAKTALKRMKSIRHPAFLTYIDALEADKLVCIVTEHVEPLKNYLHRIRNERKVKKHNAISYGLHQVSTGLGFLINECNLQHNNLSMSTIFVNESGMWKIGGLEFVTSTLDNETMNNSTSLSNTKYFPPERRSGSGRTNTSKWAGDSFGLGCLIWEVFNGPLDSVSNLRSILKIEKSLVPHYERLIIDSPNKRISPSDFVKDNKFFKNNFVDSMLFIEEIQIKENNEKQRFFNNLSRLLDDFPDDICKNKILPQLITIFEFSSSGSAMLGPFFKIGKLLDESEYEKRIVPCVIKLFASKDRATRARLLQEVEHFMLYLKSSVVNDQIFPHVLQGFVDSNATIREHTVKCMLHLAPKLNYNNLNEEMMKNFARLQSKDEEGGIRTNTTVCMGKIACYLHPQIRKSVLIHAFLRSMRDPFAPSRIAGILALSATQNFYTLRDTATKIMPALCHLTMDPEKSVRDQAFKALKGFVSKIEKVSEDPSLGEQMEADVNAAGSAVSSTPASWASWAVSSVASKFYRSKTTTVAATPSNVTKHPSTIDITLDHKDDTNSSVMGSRQENIDAPSVDCGDWGSLEESHEVIENKVDGWDIDDETECKPDIDSSDKTNFFKEWDKDSSPVFCDTETETKQENNDLTTRRVTKKRGPMKLGATKIK